jgi:hypothetical protein
MANIQNPGSALGEAIGAEMEKALNVFLTNLVENRAHHYLSKSPVKNKGGTQKKLLMYDKSGTAFNIDAVTASESMQPIILIESKYIRYTKHNRDKGSWICTAHPAIRRRYQSIRSSIAVLAGNWSSSSRAMIKSKDREAANTAWNKFSTLTEAQKAQIGNGMINGITDELEKRVLNILDDTIEREIEVVRIELRSNLGEIKEYEFSSVEEAIEFLNTTELKEMFITTDSLTLFDPMPVSNENN